MMTFVFAPLGRSIGKGRRSFAGAGAGAGEGEGEGEVVQVSECRWKVMRQGGKEDTAKYGLRSTTRTKRGEGRGGEGEISTSLGKFHHAQKFCSVLSTKTTTTPTTPKKLPVPWMKINIKIKIHNTTHRDPQSPLFARANNFSDYRRLLLHTSQDHMLPLPVLPVLRHR